MEYYSNYILNERFRINESDLGTLEHYYEVCFEPKLNTKVSKRHSDSLVDWIVYYNIPFTPELEAYHMEKYANINLAIIDNVASDAFFVKEYAEKVLSRIWLYTTDKDLKVVTEALFTPNYELSEYRENFYNKENKLRKEKIFMPSVWHIEEHEE